MEHLTENGFLIKVASGVDSGWDGASSCSSSHIVTSCCTPMASRSGSLKFCFLCDSLCCLWLGVGVPSPGMRMDGTASSFRWRWSAVSKSYIPDILWLVCAYIK